MCSNTIQGQVPLNLFYVNCIDWSKVILSNSINAMCLQSTFPMEVIRMDITLGVEVSSTIKVSLIVVWHLSMGLLSTMF